MIKLLLRNQKAAKDISHLGCFVDEPDQNLLAI